MRHPTHVGAIRTRGAWIDIDIDCTIDIDVDRLYSIDIELDIDIELELDIDARPRAPRAPHTARARGAGPSTDGGDDDVRACDVRACDDDDGHDDDGHDDDDDDDDARGFRRHARPTRVRARWVHDARRGANDAMGRDDDG